MNWKRSNKLFITHEVIDLQHLNFEMHIINKSRFQSSGSYGFTFIRIIHNVLSSKNMFYIY